MSAATPGARRTSKRRSDVTSGSFLSSSESWTGPCQHGRDSAVRRRGSRGRLHGSAGRRSRRPPRAQRTHGLANAAAGTEHGDGVAVGGRGAEHARRRRRGGTQRGAEGGAGKHGGTRMGDGWSQEDAAAAAPNSNGAASGAARRRSARVALGGRRSLTLSARFAGCQPPRAEGRAPAAHSTSRLGRAISAPLRSARGPARGTPLPRLSHR
jgi:hypothetical protein